MSSIPNTTKQAYEIKKTLLEEIKLLSKEEYEEIFRIIKRGNVEYTENSNGVFFDLAHCSDELCQKLEKFIELCKTQRKSEEQRTQELEVLRQESNH